MTMKHMATDAGGGHAMRHRHPAGAASHVGPRAQVSHRAGLALPYPPAQAIWLFSAEGERLWLEDQGWNPDVLRGDGFGENDVFALHGTVFITVIFDADAGRAQYARVKEGETAGMVRVDVRPDAGGSSVEVRYDMTGLSDAGDAALGHMTDAAFAEEIAGWQKAIEANAARIEPWLAARG